jgi:PAS domain S-box-containing protein
MHERNKILLCSILIMTVISAVVVAVVIPILYHAAFEGQRRRLCEIAQLQAHLLTAVVGSTVNADEALQIMQGAHENFTGFGQTGEFSLARRHGDLVQFLLHRRHDSLLTLKPMPVAVMQKKPMGQALLGMSGSMVGLDYRGEPVLAAYEPVPALGWGIVAKIDVSEIREPFVKAGILAGAAALLVILCGVGLFFRLCDPLIRRLEESEASTQAILDTAPDGIVTFDGLGAVQSMNHAAERLFGYTADEVVGQSVDRLLPALTREDGTDGLKFSLAHGTGTRLGVVHETTGQHRNGTSFPADVALSEMHVGERRLFTSIVRDIAQRKRLEAQLRQLQKRQAVGTLVGGIAHDFNNILAVILGYTELALFKVPRRSAAKRYLEDVLTAAKRAKDLVQQILAFSRQNETERNRVRLPPLVREALSLLRASLPSTVEIRYHIDKKVEMVLADPTQIHQVLMNLGANAEYAMRKEGGVLDVHLEAVELDAMAATVHPNLVPGPYVRLTVRDTGRGMPPEIMERIFEPFFTTKGVGEGTGMGLAVVHGIVMNHGGAITVDSTPGQGTTFVIYLPRLPEVGGDDGAAPEPTPRGKGRILFVDDEESLVHLGREILAPLGYDIVPYTSSREALDAFRAAPERFDLVITDQTMPQMTGEVLTQELRRIRANIPVILCTGFSHTIDGEKAKGLGIDAFLMKSIEVREWGTTIQRVLAHYPA